MTKFYHDYHKPSKARERKQRNKRKVRIAPRWMRRQFSEFNLALWFMRFMGMSIN